ncbi:hypothetical protein [Sphingomonas mollis]|uniref:Glycosyltransferase n=1 Tax=Sphingomonas mollis TaxID=2795726 RepID=A0ABS0XL56_9SPHN|nr:hypothetical protein [Sphingomonas sp. BT553]MBJ6120764.1 hypothetical protein [Sphingomonas sp. BT553]
MSVRPVTLLMTATVAPARGMRTSLGNPQARRDEYIAALCFYRDWIGRGIDRIVFVDNSNSDLSSFNAVSDGYPITLLSYQGISYPAAHGYGYGEMALIQHAMDHVPELGEGVVVKVTGRYRVTNLTSVIQSAAGVDFAGDIWNWRRPWLDMRIMMWTKRGYNMLLRDSYLLLRDDENRLPPEMILSRHIMASTDVAVRTYLMVDPIVLGVRGMDGKDWGRGSLAFKRRVRALTRPFSLVFSLYPGARRDKEYRSI